MIKSIIHYSLFIIPFLALISLLAPHLASAAVTGIDNEQHKLPYWRPLVSCSGAPTSDPNFPVCRPSGAGGEDDLLHTFIHLAYFGMTITLFFLAPALFAWGGILILISGASPGKLEQGKKILTGTVIGVLITLFALLIVRTFLQLVGICGVGGFTPPC